MRGAGGAHVGRIGYEACRYQSQNSQKLACIIILILIVPFLRTWLRDVTYITHARHENLEAEFGTRQAANLRTTFLLLLGLLSIRLDDPTRLATALDLVTNGLAFALQKVVTSIAGYFVILRGDNWLEFTVRFLTEDR